MINLVELRDLSERLCNALGEGYPTTLGVCSPSLEKLSFGALQELLDSGKKLHEGVMFGLVRDGWVCGRKFDNGDLIHPDLVDWDVLEDRRQNLYITLAVIGGYCE